MNNKQVRTIVVLLVGCAGLYALMNMAGEGQWDAFITAMLALLGFAFLYTRDQSEE